MIIDTTSNLMGIDVNKLKKYNNEYTQLNPYNLPDVRGKRRRVVRSEFVMTTREE